MNDGQQADAADVLASIGRHWGWIMAFGVLTLLAGVAVLAWPGRTLVVIAVLFGVQLIVTGIFRFVAAFAADDLTGGTRVLLAVLGVLSLIIGLYAVRHVLVTLLALACCSAFSGSSTDPWNCSWPCPTRRWRTAAGRP